MPPILLRQGILKTFAFRQKFPQESWQDHRAHRERETKTASVILPQVGLALVLLWLLSASRADKAAAVTQAFYFDKAADGVLGQPNYQSGTINSGGISAQSLNNPNGVAIDLASGRLYVADAWNHRVLSWSNAAGFIIQQPADMVFGQLNDFTTNAPNKGGISADSLYRPMAVAVDGQGNLYVADFENNRVLEYYTPATTDTTADVVIGQPNFTSFNAPKPPSADSLKQPAGVTVDTSGNLYVADNGNNRLLMYTAPLTNAQSASRVYGQNDFTSFDSGTSADKLNSPQGMAVDDFGNLYVADTLNNRVLEFNPGDTTADRVYGQPDFISNDVDCARPTDETTLCGPAAVAIDLTGVLFIADTEVNRVLMYLDPLTSDAISDGVFGQNDFHSDSNLPLSVLSQNYPNGVALDAESNLYVADTFNHRVLRYNSGMPAGVVFLPALMR